MEIKNLLHNNGKSSADHQTVFKRLAGLPTFWLAHAGTEFGTAQSVFSFERDSSLISQSRDKSTATQSNQITETN